jgi:hypothetical protein
MWIGWLGTVQAPFVSWDGGTENSKGKRKHAMNGRMVLGGPLPVMFHGATIDRCKYLSNSCNMFYN